MPDPHDWIRLSLSQHSDPEARPTLNTPTATRPDLSVVIPIYNEEEALDGLFNALVSALDGLGLTYEVVCVDDGSQDHSLEGLLAWQEKLPQLKVVELSRNFGKEAALTAGLELACGDAIVPMDADLQDPPEIIPEMLNRWTEGFDVVLAQRASRPGDSQLKRIAAAAFYWTINKLSPIDILPNTGDFRLMDRRVVEALRLLPEKNRFMKGLFAWVGFRTTVVRYSRPARIAGTTKWSWWKLWNFALDGIFSFSNLPLKIWVYLGLAFSGLSFLYATFLILRTILFGIDFPGYASIMVSMLFLEGVQLISLGVIGEYVGRIYNETKRRPSYLVKDLHGLQTNKLPMATLNSPIQCRHRKIKERI
ncbi:Uncharacterized glycosyltransferase sll0501 [Desulfovibrionales bacterium]